MCLNFCMFSRSKVVQTFLLRWIANVYSTYKTSTTSTLCRRQNHEPYAIISLNSSTFNNCQSMRLLAMRSLHIFMLVCNLEYVSLIFIQTTPLFHQHNKNINHITNIIFYNVSMGMTFYVFLCVCVCVFINIIVFFESCHILYLINILYNSI